MLKHKDSEKDIEKTLCRKVKDIGGHALKFTSGIETGYPDRIVLLPNVIVIFVELKSQGEKPRKLQTIRHDELRALGFAVVVIDSLAKVDDFIIYCKHL